MRDESEGGVAKGDRSPDREAAVEGEFGGLLLPRQVLFSELGLPLCFDEALQ